MRILKFNELVNESYYEDLTPYTYSRNRHNELNIGWLDNKHDFEKGEVPDGLLERLECAEEVDRHKGSHSCEICGGAHSSTVKIVYGKDKSYKFPQMITHYISEHKYRPPQEFIDLVMSKEIVEEKIKPIYYQTGRNPNMARIHPRDKKTIINKKLK